MKYALPIIIAACIACPFGTADAQDEWSLSAQVGVSLPFGTFDETYQIGLGGTATVLYRLMDDLHLTGSAGYHQFGREVKGTIAEGSLSTIPITVGLRYVFEPSGFTPYLTGEVGLHIINWSYDNDVFGHIDTYEGDETDVGFAVGGGALVDLNILTMDANLKYTLAISDVFDITYLQLNVGALFQL